MQDESLETLIKQIRNKYYGKYRGFVLDNEDPEQRGRVKLRVPAVLGSASTNWALPCLPFGGLEEQGSFWVPEVNAQVWVEFEGGNRDYPIWTGTFWPSSAAVPTEAAATPPTARVFKTPSGHLLVFEDKQDEEQITLSHPKGAGLEIDPNGSIALTSADGATLNMDADGNQLEIKDANGNTLTMNSSGTTVEDANGNQIEMAATGITVKGQQIVVNGSQVMLGGSGGEPILKGQSFLTLFATHVHPTGMGLSGPPVPQGEPSSLSTKVMTS